MTQVESLPAYAEKLAELAESVLRQAHRAGAADAEVMLRESDEFEANVRLGELETLQNSGARGVGLRVLVGDRGGNRVGSTSSSDLTPQGLERLVSSAIALAKISSPDPLRALPEREALGAFPGELALYHGDVYSLPDAERIEYARRVEAAALAADPRIRNSAGGGFSAATSMRVLANSRGFLGASRSSYCGIHASPIATGVSGEMQRGGWGASARTLTKLESPEAVGAEAARRTLRRLDARKVPTQQVPVVFAPEVASSLLSQIADAVSGDAVYRGASFLAGKLGSHVAAANITVVDDGTMPGLFGSTPFDGEGLPAQRTLLIENGRLNSYLLNTYTARKLGLASTANATRGLAGNPGIGTHNLYLPAGDRTAEEIIASVPNGLYVTEFLGRGINLVTGDYSRGASGLWIENGQLSHAVQEITVAGNLREMLHKIAAVASDLEFRHSTASPTLLLEGLTVAGA